MSIRRQSDSEDRRESNRLDTKQGRHLIRQAPQLFEPLALNDGVEGQSPLRSLGGSRGIFSHVREYPPYPVQRHRRCHPPPRCARKAKRRLRSHAAPSYADLAAAAVVAATAVVAAAATAAAAAGEDQDDEDQDPQAAAAAKTAVIIAHKTNPL